MYFGFPTYGQSPFQEILNIVPFAGFSSFLRRHKGKTDKHSLSRLLLTKQLECITPSEHLFALLT